MTKAYRHRSGSDMVETPFSMTQQLLDNEKFTETIWEPACGNNAIIKVLKKNKYNCFGTDVKENFLKIENKKYDIITNPPYKLLDEFIIHAKKTFLYKFAFLCQMNHLHGQKRFNNNLFKWLKTVYIFTRQSNLKFTGEYNELRRDGKYPSGCVVYAWLIWERDYNKRPEIKWIDNNKFILRKGDQK